MSQAPEQPERMDIATTRFDCGYCGDRLDNVILGLPDSELSWMACPHCEWDDRPERYEPGAFYSHRYGAE